ncbi:hypothetical protein [Clostridium butyricum]|nr:hypothetical protein [Clostridium butyricum]AXB86051.1 hypothetical protein DRB99_14035 [Clostridium butyricum]
MLNNILFNDEILKHEMATFKNNKNLLNEINSNYNKRIKQHIYIIQQIIGNMKEKEKFDVYINNLKENKLNRCVDTI